MAKLFSAFGIDWSLLIAQAINFAIVLVALWYFLYRPVLRILEKRRKTIAKGVEDAEYAAEKLADADSEAMKRVHAADDEADTIVVAAREAAQVEKTHILDAAQVRADQSIKDAHIRATEESAQILRKSEQEIARLAILAAEKVMTKSHD